MTARAQKLSGLKLNSLSHMSNDDDDGDDENNGNDSEEVQNARCCSFMSEKGQVHRMDNTPTGAMNPFLAQAREV